MFVGHIEEILAYAWFDWKEWSEWSPCSNMGLKTRTRECPGVHCLDDGQGNAINSNGTEIADCTVSTYYKLNLYHTLCPESSVNIPILFQVSDLCFLNQNCIRNPKMGSKQSITGAPQ